MYGGEEMSRQFGMGMEARQQQMAEKIAEFEASGMSRDRAVSEVEKSFGLKFSQRAAELGEQQNTYAESAAERERAKGEYQDVRSAPYQEYGAISGYMRGAQQPNVSGIAGINVNPIDAAGIGMGIAGLEEEAKKTETWADIEKYKAQKAVEAAAAGKTEVPTYNFESGGGGGTGGDSTQGGVDDHRQAVDDKRTGGGSTSPFEVGRTAYSQTPQTMQSYSPYQGFGGLPMQGCGGMQQPMFGYQPQPYGVVR